MKFFEFSEIFANNNFSIDLKKLSYLKNQNLFNFNFNIFLFLTHFHREYRIFLSAIVISVFISYFQSKSLSSTYSVEWRPFSPTSSSLDEQTTSNSSAEDLHYQRETDPLPIDGVIPKVISLMFYNYLIELSILLVV